MKKVQTEGLHIMPEMADFHGVSGLWTLAIDMVRRTLSGQVEGQAAGRAPRGQVPNSKEGHQVTTRVPNSHETTGSGKRALSG